MVGKQWCMMLTSDISLIQISKLTEQLRKACELIEAN